MSAVISISTGKSYGVSRVCRVWGLSRASVYRDLQPSPPEPPVRRRPGPQGPMPDAELVEAIKQVIIDSPFYGEGHRKVWARLSYKGIRTSKARGLRLMRENGLCAKPCFGATHGPRGHDGTIISDTIDEMWGTDMTTTLLSTGQQVAVFVAADHCSASCVGIHAAIRGTRFEALQPIRQGVRECFGAIGKDVTAGLTIRHDNGSQYISHDFQNECR
ncbi:IS3 family transposase [Tateyamaria sp.]|uniref:IS3 family transposase n=1 Tax=Tateyamaria sp. TaxID=1929288 RepID=UPI003B214C9C